ncbi:MAG: ABC-type transport auxiliary lipoprotein family protein [Burkholderiaceae bacterium]|jgi:cholesterol transport system auxiliary component|nr:ABC-type transport auxiliary lipoprotein family protein [Burkholderiaceae bacterium]
MKSMAASVCRTSARTFFGLIFLLLAGCTLPLPDKPARPQLYDLGPALPLAAAGAQPGGAVLALDPVAAPATFDSVAIIYRLAYAEGGQQARSYALARWSMPPPQLLAQRLREAFSVTRPVVDADAGLAALELRAELDEFTHVFTAPGVSEGVVRLRVTIARTTADAHTSRLLGQRTFSARQPAPSADASGGAAALRAATDDVVQQVVGWADAIDFSSGKRP